MTNDSNGVLAGLRVMDMAEGLAGSMAALLLAEVGADIIKLDHRGSMPFAVWNRSKRSVALDWRNADRELFLRLLRSADVLVHDFPAPQASQAGLDAKAIDALTPGLIVCSIAGFPAGHPDEALPVDDLLVLARAGILDEQKPCRREGPTYLRFPAGSWGAAWLAAIGVVARLLDVKLGGTPGEVATSLLQGALVHSMAHWRQAECPSESLRTGWPKGAPDPIVECADGVWLHVMQAPDEVPTMKDALAALGDAEVARLNAALGFRHPLFPNLAANATAFRQRPSTEWLRELWAAGVPVQPAQPMGGAYTDEQARANDYVVEIDDPGVGRTLQPNAPIEIAPPMAARPRSGSRDVDPVALLSEWSPRHAAPRASQRRYLLEGLKVLDFGQHLAGPLAPMLMADLGADVIKVESLHGDGMRPHEWAFVGCNRGKRAIAIDLKRAEARPLLERLVREADVAIHNLRMPAAEKLGLGYDALRAINPRLVYAHASAYGRRGPRKHWPGYDQLFQALCGWELENAGVGNPPVWLRLGAMDHQCALALLFATLLALLKRETTGQGQRVCSSILGAGLWTTAGEVTVRPSGAIEKAAASLDALQTGVGAGRRLYQCSDGWLALVADEDALTRLHRLLEVDPANQLEARLASMNSREALDRCRATGAQAVPVATDQSQAFLNAAHNRSLHLVAGYRHVQYGELRQPGAFWSLGGRDVSLRRAPPALGQHSREILAGLGIDAREIDALVAGGTIGASESVRSDRSPQA